jgi:hypothetical protein
MADLSCLSDVGSALGDLVRWLGDHAKEIVVPILGFSALWNWVATRDERLRDGYAEAIRTLVAWREFPYRVLRRSADDAPTYATLTDKGHKIQEDLAYWTSWIASDSTRVADAYRSVVRALRGHLIAPIQTAWDAPAANTGAAQARTLRLEVDQERCEAIIEAFQAVAHARRAPYRWFRRSGKQIAAIREHAEQLAVSRRDRAADGATDDHA